MSTGNWRDEQEKSVLELMRSKFQPRTKNQEKYFHAIQKFTVTICTGPAGTGKTVIPCALAARMFKEQRINKIIVTRPMITCGKPFGFLPGDLDAKVLPYMRPLFDSFSMFFSAYDLQRAMDEKKIEMVPLELMRGLSIKDAVIICDEAQNADASQLEMLCTRIDTGTKLIISGDVMQKDNHDGALYEMIERFLPNLHKEIAIVRLTVDDIQRPEIVKWMVRRWGAE